MADDQAQDQNNSENSDKPEDQNISKSESQTSDTQNQSDISETPSTSESSETRPAQEETKAEESKPTPKSVSVNLEKIIEQIEKLSVLELADLVHALEDRFGVSAQAPIAAGASGTQTEAAEPVEEKTTFNVILTASGANKIAVIKAVRELVPTLGLKEAKDLVEGAPKQVLESVNKTTAEEAKQKLTTAGGTVELQ